MMLLAAASLASCTMQKRYHSGGWNVELGLFNKDKQSAPAVKQETRVAAQQAAPVKEVEAPAAVAVEAVTPAEVANVATAQATTATPAIDAFHGTLKTAVKMQRVAAGPEVIFENATATKDVKNSTSNKSRVFAKADSNAKTHWAAIVGMISGILGLFIFPFLFGACGIVFSAIALSAIKKSPEKWKGRGMAITGLITGIVAVVVIFLVIALLLV